MRLGKKERMLSGQPRVAGRRFGALVGAGAGAAAAFVPLVFAFGADAAGDDFFDEGLEEDAAAAAGAVGDAAFVRLTVMLRNFSPFHSCGR